LKCEKREVASGELVEANQAACTQQVDSLLP